MSSELRKGWLLIVRQSLLIVIAALFGWAAATIGARGLTALKAKVASTEQLSPSKAAVIETTVTGQTTTLTGNELLLRIDPQAVLLVGGEPNSVTASMAPLVEKARMSRVASVVSTAHPGEVICFDGSGAVSERFDSFDTMLWTVISRSRASESYDASDMAATEAAIHTGDRIYEHETVEGRDLNHDGRIGCMSTKP